jgi:hypothetical protein
MMLQLIVAAIALHWHLRTVTALPAQLAALVAGVVLAACFGGYTWFVSEQIRSDINYIPPPRRIFPPAWSKQDGVAVDTFIDAALMLRDAADAKRLEALQ